MLKSFALVLVFGRPIFIYFGLLALLGFLSTAAIGALNLKGNHKIPFKWHPRVAKISIALALIHAILAISLYF